ncbi:M56 family metallopeptidase [Aporhodopirellula aestuarii]|uniref:M56 family metallopeptidase n=1 Tax=Aporhodopirellula aestuarii TaxID=2950107 RepID=A0ABT0UC94_9BACT|nr:M56 family metallopeptidase [Aporhodopirellula aestuarii]MCM2374110.1 M56 family metallopeptidase [Aporhodopirellula aestuarii]
MNTSLLFEVASTLCVQTAIVVAVCVGLQRWVGNVRSASRLWTCCFVSIIAMIAAGVLLPHRRLFHFPDLGPREVTVAFVTWQGRLAIGLLTVWAIGAALSLARKAILCGQLVRFLNHRCESIDQEELLARLQLPSNPHLCVLTSSDIQGPFCWQLHRPTIVIPETLMSEDDTTLRHVLLHEIEHLRTQHPMQHFLQGVCSTVFWFHPAVWIAARDAELTREFLCDEVAATACGKFGAYLRTLAKVSERCGSASCTNVPRGTLAFGNRKSTLVKRCDRLVELAQKPRKAKSRRPILATICLVVVVALVQQVWLPTNVMASNRSDWSPWPSWTARALHNAFDVHVRDFEAFENRVHVHEWMSDSD